MEDDNSYSGAAYDSVCERVQAVRNIASDLETIKSPAARRILTKAAELVLQHMEPPKARIVGVITNAAKSAKEKPL
jgi:hypothetical protein